MLNHGASVEEELIMELQNVPEKLLTTELCLEAMENLLKEVRKFVPEGLRDKIRSMLANN